MSVIAQKYTGAPPQIAPVPARVLRAMPSHAGLRTFADLGFATPEPIDLERFDAFLEGTATRRADIIAMNDSRWELWQWRGEYLCAKCYGRSQTQLTTARILGGFAAHSTRWAQARFPSRYQATTHRLSTRHFLQTWHARQWSDAGAFALKTGAYFLFGCGLVPVALTWLECARSAYSHANAEFGAGPEPSRRLGRICELEGDALSTSAETMERLGAIEHYARAQWWYRYGDDTPVEKERCAEKLLRLAQRECARLGARAYQRVHATEGRAAIDPLADALVQLAGKMRNITFGIAAVPIAPQSETTPTVPCIAEHVVSPTNIVLQCYPDGGLYLSVQPPISSTSTHAAPSVRLGSWDTTAITEPVLNECIAQVQQLRHRGFLWRAPADATPVSDLPSPILYTRTWADAHHHTRTLYFCEHGEIIYRTPHTNALLLIGLWHFGVT